MFDSLLNAFRAPDIRRRILFVFGMLIIVRGLNRYPQDIEATARMSHPLLEVGTPTGGRHRAEQLAGVHRRHVQRVTQDRGGCLPAQVLNTQIDGRYIFGGNLVIAGIVISLACYAGVVVVLYRLVALDFGRRTAFRATLYLSIFPTAFFWQAVYSESMFLMLSAACILWSTEGRWKLAGLAGLAAALTRSAGFLLIVPMAICYYEQRDWKLRRTDASVASLLMIPEGLMVWMAYLSLSFGKPLLFAQVQDQWRRYLAVPTYALWKGFVAAFQGARQLISGQTSHLYWPATHPGAVMPLAVANLTNFTSLVIAGLAICYGLRRLPLALSAYALVTSTPLLSMPRFVLAAFPVFMSMALFTDRRPRAHTVICTLSIALCVVLTAKFAIFSWVA